MAVINISAQESNKSQKIDSLQNQLNELQHKYDFLECEYELYCLKNDLRDYKNDLKASINNLLILLYHNNYEKKHYTICKNTYNESKKELISLEILTNVTKAKTFSKIESTTFKEVEIDILKEKVNTIDYATKSAKATLKYYKDILDTLEGYE